jgi:hypothetical protein
MTLGRGFGSRYIALSTDHILAYPQPRKRFVVDTDANYVGIGGVMPQVKDRQELVIACYSKIPNTAKRNCCFSRRDVFHCEEA